MVPCTFDSVGQDLTHCLLQLSAKISVFCSLYIVTFSAIIQENQGRQPGEHLGYRDIANVLGCFSVSWPQAQIQESCPSPQNCFRVENLLVHTMTHDASDSTITRAKLCVSFVLTLSMSWRMPTDLPSSVTCSQNYSKSVGFTSPTPFIMHSKKNKTNKLNIEVPTSTSSVLLPIHSADNILTLA